MNSSHEFLRRIDAPHGAGIEESVRHCLIHNTLLDPPSISLEALQSA
jgi:hypothetical protein